MMLAVVVGSTVLALGVIGVLAWICWNLVVDTLDLGNANLLDGMTFDEDLPESNCQA